MDRLRIQLRLQLSILCDYDPITVFASEERRRLTEKETSRIRRLSALDRNQPSIRSNRDSDLASPRVSEFQEKFLPFSFRSRLIRLDRQLSHHPLSKRRND